MASSDTHRLRLSVKLAYAAPAFALAVVGIPIYVYIPKFYTDVMGMDIALLGILLFSVRLFDAVTDPLIGGLSDKAETRFGRRRPFIAVGSFLVAGAMVMLFTPPVMSPGMTAVWFGVSIYALFLFWTAVVVPYESLGPEITFDYDERTELFGLRDGFLIAGTLMAASSPALVRWIFGVPKTPSGEASVFFLLGILYAPLLIITCWWCIATIKELSPIQKQRLPGLLGSLRETLKNRPFLILLASYTVSAIGSSLPATLILYYVEYVLRSKMADFFLLLYFATGIVFLPLWVHLAKKIGKKSAWIISMTVNTGAFTGVFFLGPGDVTAYGVLVFLSGIGFGATLALPSAMQADVIDYDELLTGTRREGHYIGIWSISKKLAAAVGIGVGLSILGAVGYTPNVEQKESVLLTLRVLYAGVPSLCNALALVIALFYPISGKKHRDIRSAVERRISGLPVVDPLRRMEPAAR